MSDELEKDVDNFDLRKEMYTLRVKSTINALKSMSFEAFLKKHIESAPEASIFDIFRNAVFDLVFATEYAVKVKSDQIAILLDILVTKLESKDGEEYVLDRLFAKLLKKARNILEAKLNIKGIFFTFEFKNFLKLFKEK